MNTGTYHNTLTEQTITCDLILQEEALYLYLQDGNKSLVIWDLRSLASVQWNGATLRIVKDAKGRESLQCSGDIARAIDSARQRTAGTPKRERSSPVPGIIFGSLVLSVLAICLLCYFFLLPWAAEKSVELVPESLEITIGDEMSKAYTGQAKEDSATWFANRFVHKLKLDNTYPLRIYVIGSPEINAFALPGGNIVLYSGILNKMDNYEQLAALLGHEVTHVAHRHSLKSIARSAASGLLIASVLGDMSGISTAILSQADQFRQLDYSRELETEADENALQTLKKNQINPRGLLQLLELLKAESVAEPGMMKYLSTHPDTQARIDHVTAISPAAPEFPVNPELESLFRGLKRSL